MEFDKYKYLGKAIIKELEFAYLYYLKKGKAKSVKNFKDVLQEYIDNREENLNILQEYLNWRNIENNSEILFQDHSNFEISDNDSENCSTKL
jgi:predicted CopG family antitoxin